MNTPKIYEIEVGGHSLSAEFGDLADQASSSVIMRSGNTAVLVSAVMEREPGNSSWFPLRVDFEERFYATGKILGSRFMRREGRPSTKAVLSSRIIDRTIRPLFDQRMRHDIQVVATVLAVDDYDPAVLAVIGASLALATSKTPWNGPVSAVQLVQNTKDSEVLVNPKTSAREGDHQYLDIFACGKDGKVNMIEVGSNEASEADMLAGLEEATKLMAGIQSWQENIIAEIGKEKVVVNIPDPSDALVALFKEHIEPRLEKIVFEQGKEEIQDLGKEWKELAERHLPEEIEQQGDVIHKAVDDLLHEKALKEGKRADGRALDEIRKIDAKAGGVSNRLHGSGTFYRGGTHVLSVLTLGGPEDSLLIDDMGGEVKQRFLHHYNFPPFSVGETGRMGSPGRREIGHGALAEKALAPMIPDVKDFPYTIRLVSEAFASNGSTSMGSVCGSTLALLDGGVPIKKPVAGIASGLVMKSDTEYAILTDIQGPEDHHGDMDFKVAGTRDGITAIQMDVKVSGVTLPMLKDALESAKGARLSILDTIEAEISAPRPQLSEYAPRIEIISIDPDKIGMVIGSGGKTINEIKDTTGVDEITIEEDGSIFITGPAGTTAKAREMIESITHEYTLGDKVEGKVIKTLDFGVIISFGHKQEGMVHISEFANTRIERVEDVLKMGDVIPAIIKEIDERGRYKLSLKDADPTYAERAMRGE